MSCCNSRSAGWPISIQAAGDGGRTLITIVGLVILPFSMGGWTMWPLLLIVGATGYGLYSVALASLAIASMAKSWWPARPPLPRLGESARLSARPPAAPPWRGSDRMGCRYRCGVLRRLPGGAHRAGKAAARARSMTARVMPSYGAGVTLGLMAATCWSLGGMFVRLTENIDAYQIVLYRSLTLVTLMGLFLLVRHKGQAIAAVRQAGLVGFAAGISIGISGVCFVASLFFITVGQSVFMSGIAPFCAALLGWWFLGERVKPWAPAMIVALMGLGIMVFGSTGEGNFTGTMLALASALFFSGFSVLLRFGKASDMTVAVFSNGVFATALGRWRSSADTTAGGIRRRCADDRLEQPGAGDHTGNGPADTGTVLFTLASRSVPAAQLALLALLEPILAAFWAYLAVGEVPTLATVIGGLIILGAIVIQIRANVGDRRLIMPKGKVA